MADRLARMYGTEEDKVNCPFYAKIGACRHGDRCGRVHNKPLFSVTVCLLHMYPNPMATIMSAGGQLTREQEMDISQRFADFYEDVFLEVSRFGEVEDVYVADNLGDHLIGNVYVKYYDEEDAAKALSALNGRWYGGRQLSAEYCPVTEFRDARCRQFDERGCSRGGYCNFMHLKEVDKALHDELVLTQPYRGHASKLPREGIAPTERYGREAGRGGGGGGGGGGRDHAGGGGGGGGYGRDYGRGDGGGFGGGRYGSDGGGPPPAPRGYGGYGGRDDRDYRGGGGGGGDRGGYDRGGYDHGGYDYRRDRERSDRDRDRGDRYRDDRGDRDYRDRSDRDYRGDRDRDRDYRGDRDRDRERDRDRDRSDRDRSGPGDGNGYSGVAAAATPPAPPSAGGSALGLGGGGGSGLGLGGGGLGLGGGGVRQ